MPIKAIVNGVEKEITRIPVLGHDIETATGTNSVTFNTSSDRIIEYDILGNTQQSGTPAPDNIIVPTFCGERTMNLFYGVYPNIGATAQYKPIFVGDGEFTLSTTCTRTTADTANIFFLAGNVSSGISTGENGVWNGNDRTVTAVDGYVTIAYRRYSVGDTADPRAADTMLNSGSTPLPYEPHGYKIPITCAGQTVPVYLGEVQTVRRVKKLVLDGTENWEARQSYDSCDRFVLQKTGFTVAGKSGYCSHFETLPFLCDNYPVMIYNNGQQIVVNYSTKGTTTLAQFKQWLSAQYAAGTPVTIWYVLATPETAIVNEPLAKIGDYADELHSTDAGVTIPTTHGSNTLTVDTTLSPSQTTVKYRGTSSIYKNAWEVRDNQDRLLWYREDTLTGVSSISFRGYGIPLKSMSVLGNSVQNGTPAPDAPIMPQFVGERTGNLFDESAFYASITGVTKQGTFSISGGTLTVSSGNENVAYTIPFQANDGSYRLYVQPNTTYYVNFENSENSRLLMFKNGLAIAAFSMVRPTTITTDSDTEFYTFRFGTVSSVTGPVTIWIKNIMLNLGSTALPYEPYGWAIPITNAGQTTPIYLGQTQTVRRIKKLVLDGTENWIMSKSWEGSNTVVYFFELAGINTAVGTSTIWIYSDRFPAKSRDDLYNADYNCIARTGSIAVTVRIDKSIASTRDDFKAWLADQYSAGTPVTVWYVLATPTTGIVNEPLCKIGDYADELTTDPNITPQTGTNTLTVDTTLSPSLLSITGHVKGVSA